jgi:3'(2'), 5'-bisphosphate nucleotidase
MELINKMIEAGVDASKAILKVIEKGFDVNYKTDKSPITMADLNASDAIVNVLSQTDIPLIGEEIENLTYEERKKMSSVWIFDPLDGTREFAKKSDEFCVCIALVENNYPKLGMIVSPIHKTMIIGGKDIGSFELKFDDNWTVNLYQHIEEFKKYQLKMLTQKEQADAIIMSRFEKSTLLTNFTQELIEKNKNLSIIKMGSAMKFMRLVKGEADVYPRFAPTMEWDISAGQAILEGVGGTVTNLKTGERLNYNKESLYNQPFIAKGSLNIDF